MRSTPRSRLPLRLFRLPGTIALAFLLSFILRENADAGQRPLRESPQIERLLRRYDRVRIDRDAVVQRVRKTGRLTISTRDRTFDIELTPIDLRAPGYRAEEERARGVRSPLPPNASRTFRGTVPRLQNSEARFSVQDGALEGVILTPAEWYYFEPLRNFSPSSNPSDMVFYRRSDLRAEALGECGATLSHRIGKALEQVEPRFLAGSSGVSMAQVATEADYEFVAATGGAAEANATILDILNQVDGIYQAQLAISIRVVYQHVWSTASDPYTSTSPANMLTEFRDYWNASFSSTLFDLAHMWTGKDMDGSTVGIAYLSVVCAARTYSYGVSQRFTSSPGKYILTAHEIGHNFGASHPDQATPPQTDCANTIMNSSVGTGTTFCPFSRTEISTHVVSNPSCLSSTPASPAHLRLPN